MKNLKIISLVGLFLISFRSYPAEFLIMNQTITLTSANNGFYFYFGPFNGPSNWVSPDNYLNGSIYFRYEMISKPTAEEHYFSFDIWGDYNSSTNTYTESAAPISGPLASVGSVSTFSSSPSTWFNHPVNGPVNWYNKSTFWRWGICHWFSKSPNYLLAPPGWSVSPESWDAWTHNSDWLPVTFKVTIVAVSQGSTFSGWENYINGGGGTKYPTPTYGIDYSAETTNKVVPSTDIYSYSSNMSSPISGNGQKLALTPGTDVYFQTPASGGNLASDIQHLDVPSRPSVPSVTIDFGNEVTSAISNTMEYSTDPAMSSAITGTNTGVSLSPGTNLYIRHKATSGQFRSGIQTLAVPSRPSVPAITIDYINEQTSAISGTMEYSTNISMTSPTTGANTGVQLTPGTDLFIREKATSSQFRSGIQTLDVPTRPAGPAISIDYLNQLTSNVPNTVEYSQNSNMTAAQTGTNVQVPVNPGTDMYFRYKSTTTQFSSQIQTLDIPDRPAAPAVGINYQTEKTASFITSDLEYDDNANMSSPSAGTGVYVNLIPGQNLYIRRKADVAHFSSHILELVVPSRPSAPVISIDYENERTSQVITTEQFYSLNSDMTSSSTGTGENVPLVPGTDMYFRNNYTGSSFISEIRHLDVPQRPVISTSVGDTVNSFFMASLQFNADTAGLGKNGLEVINAEVLQNGLDVIIDPVNEGEVSLKIKANAILAGNFESEELVTVYKVLTSINQISDDGIEVYPNPAESGFINILLDRTLLPSDIRIIDLNGAVLYSSVLYLSPEKVSVETLDRGVYILQIRTNKGNSIVKKLVRK